MLRVPRHVEEQRKNHYRYQGQPDVEQDLPTPWRAPILPIVKLRTHRDSHLILMLKVQSEVMGRGVPVLGITLQRAVYDLLQLRRDRRINFPWRHWVVEQ